MTTLEMEELDLGMTNFDGSIDEGFAEAFRLQRTVGRQLEE